jgi:pyruvate/2-oxoglutarate dehydrogenase complex dihydrolipoamide dehydrogenase (E3) component
LAHRTSGPRFDIHPVKVDRRRLCPLTPVSGHDGNLVAQNLLDGNRHRPDYRGVPSVAFTIPPIAAVGLSEAEARAKGLKFRLHSEKVPDWYAARRLNESVYGFKTLVEEDTDRILGAHLVGRPMPKRSSTCSALRSVTGSRRKM